MVPAEAQATRETATVALDATGGVELMRATTDPRWQKLTADSRSPLFVDQRWLAILEATYGLKVVARVCCDDVLPFCDIDDGRGHRIVSLPFCDFIDTGMKPASWLALVDPLIESGAAVVIDSASGHPAELDPRFTSTVDGICMIVELDAPLDDLFAGFSTLTRRQIRKAERRGIDFVATQDPAILRRFHELHVGVRKYRHNLLAQPFEMFDQIAHRFGDDWTVIAGMVDATLAGGCLLLRTGDTWHYKFSVSHPDFRADGVSHGAVFGALQHCVATGASTFDFGRSDLAHGGLVDFKRRFGSDEYPLTRHVASPLASNQFSTDLGQLTELLTNPDVPDSVTAQAGSVLYRYFA